MTKYLSLLIQEQKAGIGLSQAETDTKDRQEKECGCFPSGREVGYQADNQGGVALPQPLLRHWVREQQQGLSRARSYVT